MAVICSIKQLFTNSSKFISFCSVNLETVCVSKSRIIRQTLFGLIENNYVWVGHPTAHKPDQVRSICLPYGMIVFRSGVVLHHHHHHYNRSFVLVFKKALFSRLLYCIHLHSSLHTLAILHLIIMMIIGEMLDTKLDSCPIKTISRDVFLGGHKLMTPVHIIHHHLTPNMMGMKSSLKCHWPSLITIICSVFTF